MFVPDSLRVMLIGGIFFDDEKAIGAALSQIDETEQKIDILLHGGEGCVSRYAVQWAMTHNKRSLAFHPNWTRDGNKARLIRDKQMIEHGKPDVIYVFPGGNIIDLLTGFDIGACPAKIMCYNQPNH